MTQLQPDDSNIELGGWRLVELLGRGGMGEVWRAEREGPGGIRRRAAIKRILQKYRNDVEVRARFLSEARINTRLEHPNIVSVIDFGEKPEPFLIFEYVAGISAADLLQEASKSRLKIPAVVAAFICAEAATALDYAHRKRDEDGKPLQIVHRDVSPHNLLLSVEGAVKVGDFGVAHAADNQFQTAIGVQVGKLVYMSPEQAAGGDIDGRADIFSLGIVLWELLTLKPCLPRDDTAETLRRIQQGLIPPPSSLEPQIPPSLDGIVMNALSPQKENRFATAGAFAQALRSFVHSLAPGFDSGEMMKICQRLAPAVQWHIPTGSMPVHKAIAQNEPSPRQAAQQAAPAQPAQAGQPAKAANGRTQMPAVSMPAQNAPANPSANYQQNPAPKLSTSQPVPPFAPMGAQAPNVPMSPTVAPSPYMVQPGSATASPSFSATAFGAQPSIHLPVNRTPVVVWIVLGVVLLGGLGVGISFAIRSRRSAASSADESPPVQTVVQGQTNSLSPGQNAGGGAMTAIPSGPPSQGGPSTGPSNGTVVPLDNPPDGSALSVLGPSPNGESESPDGGTARDADRQRIVGEIQHQLSQQREELKACVNVPSGARARITLQVDYDGALNRVALVQASSSNGTLSLSEQQCLKNVAQRAVHPSGGSNMVRARWSLWIESSANFEHQ